MAGGQTLTPSCSRGQSPPARPGTSAIMPCVWEKRSVSPGNARGTELMAATPGWAASGYQQPRMGDFALVETNLKLSTSMRRPSQRKSTCGSPQHISNTAAWSNATIWKSTSTGTPGHLCQPPRTLRYDLSNPALLEEAKADLPKTPRSLEIAARRYCIASPIHNPTRWATRTTGAEDFGTKRASPGKTGTDLGSA